MVLESVMLDGPAWEESTAQYLDNFLVNAAVGKKHKTFKQKRPGAKAVKHFETNWRAKASPGATIRPPSTARLLLGLTI